MSSKFAGQDEFIKRVRLYIMLRWYLLLVLSVSGFITAKYANFSPQQIKQIVGLVIIGTLSNIIFELAVRVKKILLRFNIYVAIAALLIITDIAIYSAGIYISGGSNDRAIIFFVLPIVITGGLFSRLYIYFTSFLCVLFYLVTTVLSEIRDTERLPTAAIFIQSIFYSSVLILVAFLTDYLYTIKNNKEIERAQTELVSLASHQLRTPATAVKGFLSFILDGELGKLNVRQRDFIQQAYNENDIELKLIDNILNVARVDLNTLYFEPKIADIGQLVHDVIDEYSGGAKQMGQTLTYRGSSNLMAFFDPQLMRMVIDNLISNASKYSSEGGRISVSVGSDNRSVKISVEDNGVGISNTEQKQLFKRFTRVGRARQGKTPGSGLGLYLAKELIKLHNGRISVVSYPNEGSIFTITLPRKAKTYG